MPLSVRQMGYSLVSREGIDERGYIGRDVPVIVRDACYGVDRARSYREMFSEGGSVLSYRIAEHGGIGRDYASAEGAGQTLGLGGGGRGISI